MGCKWSGVPRPSMVVISSPSCMTANVRHDVTRRPFTCTVHAPHCPWSHPFLVPVNWSRSRSRSNSDVRTSTVITCGSPFTVNVMVRSKGISVACIVFSPAADHGLLDIIRNNDIMGSTQHYQNQGLLRRGDTDALLPRPQTEPSGSACLHQFRPRRV